MMQTPSEPPVWPQLRLNLTEQGMSVQIALGPTTVIVQMIEASAMDDLTKQWREFRRTQNNQIALIHDIKRSKNN